MGLSQVLAQDHEVEQVLCFIELVLELIQDVARLSTVRIQQICDQHCSVLDKLPPETSLFLSLPRNVDLSSSFLLRSFGSKLWAHADRMKQLFVARIGWLRAILKGPQRVSHYFVENAWGCDNGAPEVDVDL